MSYCQRCSHRSCYSLGVIYSLQEAVNVFSTESYSKPLNEDHPWNEMFKKINKQFLGVRNNQLSKMIIISCISIFEAFNKDFFKFLYTLRPKNLKRKDQVNLTYEELIEFSSMEAIYETLMMQKVSRFGRISIDELSEELDKKHKLNLTKDFTKWEEFFFFFYCI